MKYYSFIPGSTALYGPWLVIWFPNQFSTYSRLLRQVIDQLVARPRSTQDKKNIDENKNPCPKQDKYSRPMPPTTWPLE
jgi:hypothetical protein